jgi:ribonuclease J
MRICIHRGAHEIGGSCVELESQGRRLLLDLGLPLGAEANTVSLLPAVPGLLADDDTLLGIVVSHPHLDHFGLLAHVRPDLPVALGAAARRILEAAAPWVPGAVVPSPGPALEDRRPFVWGPFRITPHLVDHSAFDAYALLVEADGQKIFYSGDFRAHGRKGKLFDRMITHPPKGLDVLLMEGSSLGRLDPGATFGTEADLEARMAGEIRTTEGLAMVYAPAQNIDRVVTVFRAAKRTGRTLVLDLYTAAILEATGNAGIPQSDWPQVSLYVPQRQRVQIKEGGRFDLLKRHGAHRIYQEALAADPASFVLLFRPVHMRDLERANALSGARLIYSMWEGYLKEAYGARVERWAGRLDIPFTRLHTSGHAGPADLKRFAEALAPRVLVPIHSFQPESYGRLFPRVAAHGDGEWWEVPQTSNQRMGV